MVTKFKFLKGNPGAGEATSLSEGRDELPLVVFNVSQSAWFRVRFLIEDTKVPS